MICVDSSIAIKWLLPEAFANESRSLYRATLARGEEIIAPTLLRYEVTNVLHQNVRRGVILVPEAAHLLDVALRFQIALDASPALHREALRLADQFRLPAAYDGHYLALAQHYGCDLWTADQRLLNRVGARLPFVRAISSYVP